jgi:hypothetical protein
MENINKFAQRVVVWLGPEVPGSRSAMSTFEYLGKQVEQMRDYHRLASQGCDEPLWSGVSSAFPYDHEHGKRSFFYLLGQSWFSRLWILQEIQLGNCYSVMQCVKDLVE